jgi:hypothetical protein
MTATFQENQPWIGVDLDGTLAYYDESIRIPDIGLPVISMLERVRTWLREGKRVKIFTARAEDPEQVPLVQSWCIRHGLGRLEVTNQKDFRMIELWDDRAIRVQTNTGRMLPRSFAEAALLFSHEQARR